jgi:hypothetical protein
MSQRTPKGFVQLSLSLSNVRDKSTLSFVTPDDAPHIEYCNVSVDLSLEDILTGPSRSLILYR